MLRRAQMERPGSLMAVLPGYPKPAFPARFRCCLETCQRDAALSQRDRVRYRRTAAEAKLADMEDSVGAGDVSALGIDGFVFAEATSCSRSS